MGSTITLEEKCDRCSSGFNSRQIDLEAAIRMKEIEEAGESEAIFLVRLVEKKGDGDPVVREQQYHKVCEGCRRVLLNMIESAGPVSRRPRGPAKKGENGEATKAPKTPKAPKAPKAKGKQAPEGGDATKTA